VGEDVGRCRFGCGFLRRDGGRVRIGGCEGCWDGSVGRLEGMGDGGDAHGGVSVGVLVEARYGGYLVNVFESLMGCRLLP
jgi:hypothetical protein